MLKRKLHKALALLTSVLMLCSILPISALLSAGAEDSNVVVNGGFENGKENWAFNSGTAEVVTDAHSGNSAIKLANPGMWAEGAVQTVSVDANSEYKIEWYSKRVEGTGVFNLYTMNASGNANLTSVSGQNWMNETSGNWVKNEYVVKTDTATSVILKFSTEVSNPGSILLDDITMIKVGGDDPAPDQPDAPAAENLLGNGDFETGEIAPWDNLWGSNTVSMVAGRDSQYAMNVVSGLWKHVRQVIAVEPNTDYVVTGWFKDVTDMTLLIKDGNDSVNVKQQPMSGGSDWTQVTLEFNSGDYTSVIVSLMGNVAESKGTFDDFTMTKVGGEQPDAPVAENLLGNGDFETGEIAPWDNLWGSNTVSMVAGRDSQYAMNVVSGLWKHVRQVITVEPNTDYVVTGWYKDVTDMTLLIKDGNDSVNVKQQPMSGGSDWTKVTLEFNSGDYTSVIVSLMGNVAESKGTFDDFMMYKKGGAEPDVPDEPDSGLVNGNFETGDLSGWEPSQDTAISADAKHDGAYGAHLKGNGGWGGLLDQTFAVTEGKDYVLTFWYKANSAGANFVIKDKATGASVANAWGDAKEWTQVTLEFTAISAQLFLNICGGGNGTAEDVYVDDFVLTEKGGTEPDVPDVPDEPDVPTFGLVNGNFETGDLSGWEAFQNTVISADAKHSGAFGAHLQGDGGWGGLLDQTFNVNEGKDYILTFWYKANASGANFVIKDKATGASVANAWGDAKEWTQVTLEFTAPSAQLFVNICGGGNGAAEDVYLDDVVLVEKSGLSDALVNGDFEQGDEGWSLGGSASIVDTAYEGTKALQLSNPGTWSEAAMQAFAVTPETNYVITWYSKRVEGNGPFNLIVMDGNNQNLKVVGGQNWMSETSGQWVKNEATIASASATEMRIKFTTEASNPGVILIDSITVVKEGEEPDEPVDPSGNLIKNGDFEDGDGGWTWNGNTVRDTDNAYTGTASARLDHDKAYGEALTQTVKMEKNTDYVIIFYTKRVSGHGAWDLFLMDGDTINNGNVNIETTDGNRWFQQDVDAGWVKTRLEFNSGDATKAYIKFGPEAENSGVFLLDNVGMYVKGNEPEEPDEPVIPVSGMVLTSYGVLNNRPISADKNLLQNANFESEGGQWNVDTFATEYVTVVDDATTQFGKKSLYFNTSAVAESDPVKSVFWMEVQPETSYVFSVWIKGAYLSDDNRGRNTVGVVDENGKFLAQGDILFLDGTRQLVPTAWDDQWHLRSVEFNSGSKTKIGIALAGWGSQMWIDDMALFEVGAGTKYVSANMGGNINLSYDISYIGCDDEDSLIPDANMNTADEAGFWADSHGWRNNFITFVDNPYEYGASMKYTSTGDKAATHIIKWVDVEPGTQYTFAVDIKILEDGFGKLVLLDDKKRDKVPFFTASFDSYDYSDYENTGWRTVVTSFNTDVYERIGIAFIDDGGEVLIDNMRLFKSEDGKNVVDAYVQPPAEPDDYVPDYDDTQDPGADTQDPTDEPQDSGKKPQKVKKPKPAPAGVDPMVWVWVGVGSAVALAGAAVAIILLVKKRKKAAAAAAAAAAAEADTPADPAPEQSAE